MGVLEGYNVRVLECVCVSVCGGCEFQSPSVLESLNLRVVEC